MPLVPDSITTDIIPQYSKKLRDDFYITTRMWEWINLKLKLQQRRHGHGRIKAKMRRMMKRW